MAGTAVKQAAEREPEPLPDAAALDRLLGISGAAWKKAAGAWKERRQEDPISADDEDQDFLAQPRHYFCRLLPWVKAVSSSAATSLRESISAPLFAMTTMS
jgi:hypothetical protein